MSNKKQYQKYAVTTMAAAAAVASVAPVATSADTVKTFPDVKEGSKGFGAVGEHYEPIMSLAQQGVITGNPEDGKFHPWTNIYRGQVAKIIAGSLDLETPEDIKGTLEKYTDVNDSNDYAENIAAVTEAGVMGVFENETGKFNEYSHITREQMASVLVRAFGLGEIDTDKDVDVNMKGVDESHQDAVQTLANLEITTQTDDYRPTENITRASFSSMVYRTMEVVEESNPEETVAYEANGDITDISDDVTYEDGNFIVPDEVTSFTFKDGKTAYNAVKKDSEWEIKQAEVEKSFITATSNEDIEGDATFNIDDTEYTATVASEETEDANYELTITFDNVENKDGITEAFDTELLSERFEMTVDDETYTVEKDEDSWAIMGDAEVDFASGTQVKKVNGDNEDVNPYGAFSPRLDFGDKTVGSLDSLTVSLLKDDEVLATNELQYDKASNADKESTTIVSPFNLGTGVHDKWAWKRGAYAENDTDNLNDYIPDQVKVVYGLDGAKYTKTLDITDELTLPDPFEK